MTFWHPLSVKEPAERLPSDAVRRLEDLQGHCNAVLGWSGDVHDDDHCYTHHKRRIGNARVCVNVFHRPPASSTPAAAAADGFAEEAAMPRVPRSYDNRDVPAAERRMRMEVIPPPPVVSQRLKPAAGLWQWQQREVQLSNEIVKRFMPPPSPPASPRKSARDGETSRKPSADAGGGGGPASSSHDHRHKPQTIGVEAASPRKAVSPAKPPRSASASPRREEVKRKILELSNRFGV